VTVGGRPAAKPSSLVDPGDAVELSAPRRFVSRGGEKLAAALDRFGVDPSARDCLDAGASTGGFTDCLLRCGAARVIAVDVGYGQLAWTLREDPRVVVMERTNVRNLRPSRLPFRPQLLTVDLSFISLGVALPALADVAARPGLFIMLVKPQFEAGRARVGRGGVVRDPDVWRDVLERVAQACRESSLVPQRAMASPLLGAAGNVEFFLLARTGSEESALDLEAAVEEGQSVGGRS
jgi:23S rRNA (cytidine1920-2'-O)/16S rRNA (cytidine1409-2'-O)-methyltransferase